ncbi:MAG TPA: tetratricopeptide repeat protein [Limnochordia bacterium]|nr:tetratricopeptide repeat protein [Limnochordia bacterium]
MKKVLVISGIAVLLLLPLLVTGWAGKEEAVRDAFSRGNELYKTEAYAEALAAYETGLEIKPEHKGLSFNAAQAAYRAGEYEQAARHYDQAEDSVDKYMNAGNSFYRAGEKAEDVNTKFGHYQKALELYREGISRYPEKVELKFNYEFVMQKLKELQQQMEQQSEDDNGQDEEPEEQEEQQEDQSGKEGQDGERSEDQSGGEGEQEDEDSLSSGQDGGQGTEEDQQAGSGENQQDEGENQDAGGWDGDQQDQDQNQAAIDRILEMLAGEEEESLKNNQGVVVGGDHKYGW